MSAWARSLVAPGTCSAGRSPFGLMGKMVAEVWASDLRTSPAVSTPCLAIAAATRSPSRSSPSAPRTRTLAPSLARSTAGPAAVPAAVARISVSRALPWPGGIVSTGRPSTSRMQAPRTVTGPRSVRPALMAGRRSWLAAAGLAVAAAPGLGADLVEFGGRQDGRLAVAQGQPVGAGQPLEQQRPVVGLGQVAAVGHRAVVAQDDRGAAVQRLHRRL